MRTQSLLHDLSALPPEAQKQVAQFVAFLRLHYKATATPKKAKRSDISTESFVGMWQGRDDMPDSTAWVRGIRHTHWAERNG